MFCPFFIYCSMIVLLLEKCLISLVCGQAYCSYTVLTVLGGPWSLARVHTCFWSLAVVQVWISLEPPMFPVFLKLIMVSFKLKA